MKKQIRDASGASGKESQPQPQPRTNERGIPRLKPSVRAELYRVLANQDLTQEAFAKKCGVSKGAFSQVITGKTPHNDQTTIDKIYKLAFSGDRYWSIDDSEWDPTDNKQKPSLDNCNASALPLPSLGDFISLYRERMQDEWESFPVELFAGSLTMDAAAESKIISRAEIEDEKRKREEELCGQPSGFLPGETGMMQFRHPDVAVKETGVLQAVQQRLTEAKPPRLFILGDAGDGKSTMLLRMARHYLAQDSQNAPVLIPAREWEDTGLPLWQYLKEKHLAEWQELAERGEELLTLVRGGRSALLVDGLDECARPAEAAQAIRRFLDEHKGDAARVPAFITCRKHFDTNLLPDFAKYELKPLEREQIEEYVRQRLDAARAERFIAELRGDPRVLALAGNGLMLAMITAKAAEGPPDRLLALPVARDELYDWAVERLLSDPATVGREPHAVFYELPDFKQAILEEIGFRAQFLLGRNVDIPEAEVVACLDDLTRDGRREWHHREKRRAVLTDIVRNSELLIETGAGYRFPHPTFQEYWAARFLARRWEEAEGDTTSVWRDWLPMRDGWLDGELGLKYERRNGQGETGFFLDRENVLPPFAAYIARPAFRETLLLFAGMLKSRQREELLLHGLLFTTMTVQGYRGKWRVTCLAEAGEATYSAKTAEADSPQNNNEAHSPWDNIEKELVLRRLRRLLGFCFAVLGRLHKAHPILAERFLSRSTPITGDLLNAIEGASRAREYANTSPILEFLIRESSETRIRLEAADKLANLGAASQRELACQTLKSLAKEASEEWVRREAISKLADLGDVAALESLVQEAMEASDRWLRLEAADKLANLGAASQRELACQALKSLARETADAYGLEAIAKLADLSDVAALESLARESEDEGVKVRSACLLADVGNEAQRKIACQVLEPLAKEASNEWYLLQAASKSAELSDDVQKRLACQTLEVLARESEVAYFRAEAVSRLAALGGVAALESLARESEEAISLRAASRLAELGDDFQRTTACQILESLARRAEGWIRKDAVHMLAEVRDVAALESLARESEDEGVKVRSACLLADVGNEAQRKIACQVLEPLAMEASERGIRFEAASKLAVLGNVAALESLATAQATEDKAEWLRLRAAEKLAELGEDSQRRLACQALESLTSGADAACRIDAASTLAKVGNEAQRSLACEALVSLAKEASDTRIRVEAASKLADFVEAYEEAEESGRSAA